MTEANITRAASSSAPDCSPFLAGCEAFSAGVKVGDNPHDETTDAHWLWMAGWVAAGEQALKAKMATRKLRLRNDERSEIGA